MSAPYEGDSTSPTIPGVMGNNTADGGNLPSAERSLLKRETE